MELLLFGYSNYYPSGGMGDLIGTYKNFSHLKGELSNVDIEDYYDIYETTSGTTYHFHDYRELCDYVNGVTEQ